jgi:SAM-dependent methyltransferase
MNASITDFYLTQKVSDYERSHEKRFSYLVEDLRLNEIKDSIIVDVGCGYGPIFQRLPKDLNNTFIGFDGANIDTNFEYHKADLSYDFFANDLSRKADYVFCFETLEHLTNPYHCLIEIKKLLKEDGILYLSIPNRKTEHNTIYPGLLYPAVNFAVFLNQMALEILNHSVHDKAFFQEVFTLQNKNWSHCNMMWRKNEEVFRNIPPHEAVNI